MSAGKQLHIRITEHVGRDLEIESTWTEDGAVLSTKRDYLSGPPDVFNEDAKRRLHARVTSEIRSWLW